MYRFENSLTGFEATAQGSGKHKWNRESCYVYPVCLMLLAGNQTTMLNINSTSAHDIILLPLRQRWAHLHGPYCCSSSVTHCLAVATLEPNTDYLPCALYRRKEKENWKVKEETAFEQRSLLELMPLVIFQQLGQTHFTHTNVFQNWSNSCRDTGITASVDKLKATVNVF